MNTNIAPENDGRKIFLVILAFLFPPLAVLEHGCGIVLLTGILTLMGWFPGVILALIMTLVAKPGPNRRRKTIQIPLRDDVADYEVEVEEQKRKGAYIRLADGEVAEVVEDDGAQPIKRKRGI